MTTDSNRLPKAAEALLTAIRTELRRLVCLPKTLARLRAEDFTGFINAEALRRLPETSRVSARTEANHSCRPVQWPERLVYAYGRGPPS